MGSLRSSSLTSFAPVVLASPVFALAAAPLSPARIATAPHASPASSLPSVATPSRVRLATSGRSPARATAFVYIKLSPSLTVC